MRSRRQFLKNSAALAGGLALGGVLGGLTRRIRTPNVLLVCVDALRADRMGYAGYHRRVTPFLDSLASRGVAFTDAVASSSWTKTSVASILTGQHPFVHSVIDPTNPLPREAQTLATVLRKNDYRTFCFQTNPWLGEEMHGFQRGTDFFRFLSHSPTSRNRIFVPGTSREAYVDGSVVVRRTCDVAGRAVSAGFPFFGYVHLMDVHSPYMPPAPYNALFSAPDSADIDDAALNASIEGITIELSRAIPQSRRSRIVDLYDGSVAYADELVGRLVEGLEKRGALERTILVICSDHGEEFWEHGWKGHAKTLYDEVLKVPLIMAGHGLPQGATVSGRVRHVDIMPTVLELLGMADSGSCDGRSVLPQISGADDDAMLAVNLAYVGKVSGQYKRSMTTLAPHMKLIESKYDDRTRYELYNLRLDPGEKEDIASTDDQLTRTLSAEFDRTVSAAAGKSFEGTEVEMSPETLEQLKLLGYL